MDTLPLELLEFILLDPMLSMKDIVSFSSTCKHFRKIVTSSNAIWKHKYLEYWPPTDVELNVEDWYSECVIRLNFEEEVVKLLTKLSTKLYNLSIKDVGIEHFSCVNELLKSHKYGYFYIRDFLVHIICLPLSQELTKKYYAKIMLKYINKQYYSKVWDGLVNLEIDHQTKEKGAIFVSQWFQIYKTGIADMVTSDLNYIADLVKQYLSRKEKDHPLLDVPEEKLLIWSEKDIPHNMFKPSDCLSIIRSISHILFHRLKYHITFDFFEVRKKHLGIDYAVLDRRATPLIFAVIFESVGRRLGVKLDILDFLSKCVLGWKEDHSLETSTYHYLFLTNTKLVMRKHWRRVDAPVFSVLEPHGMQKIALKATFDYCISPLDPDETWYSVVDCSELALLIKPHSIEWYQRISRFCMLREVDSRDILKKLENVQYEIPDEKWKILQPTYRSLKAYQKNWNYEYRPHKKLKIKKRTEDINFAVGMLVRDFSLNYGGIIYGWDKKCQYDGYRNKSDRGPYYKLLVEGGTTKYVSQNCLEILNAPPFIPHPLTGRFFDEFCTTYYRPNKELQKEYPEDLDALFKILKKARHL